MTHTDSARSWNSCADNITRPAIAERRLSLANNGSVIVALKTPYDDGTTHTAADLHVRPCIHAFLITPAHRVRSRSPAVPNGGESHPPRDRIQTLSDEKTIKSSEKVLPNHQATSLVSRTFKEDVGYSYLYLSSRSIPDVTSQML